MVAIDAQLNSDIVSALREVPDIEQLRSTMGAWDLVTHITTPTMERFKVVLHYLRSIPGVRATQTSFLMAIIE